MHVLTSDDGKTHAVIMNTAEARHLHNVLIHATEPKPDQKPIRKRTAAWNIAQSVALSLCIW